MGLCDLCRNHAAKRYIAYGNEFMSAINFTPAQLRQMPTGKLNILWKSAREGIMVCQDCKKLCFMADAGCRSYDRDQFRTYLSGRGIGAYTYRTEENKKLMRMVENELRNRR